jgi:hypothetical protein
MHTTLSGKATDRQRTKNALKGLFKMSIAPLSSLETRRGGDLTVHYKPRGDPYFNFLAVLSIVRH